MFDPHAEQSLVRPDVTEDDAVRIARERHGLAATARELGSNQDRNFLITPSDGVDRFLLKFDNAVFADAELEAMNAVLHRLAAGGLSIPVPVASSDGADVTRTTLDDDRVLRARLLTFAEGEALVDDGHLSPDVIAGFGRLAGRVVAELADVQDPLLDRDLQWDLRASLAVVLAYADEIDDRSTRDRVVAAAQDAWARVQAVAEQLPIQAIHGDITDDNVVGSRDDLGRVRPESIIDWGDLSLGWRVAELAVTLTGLLHHQVGRPTDVLPAVVAFDDIAGLRDAELEALWPLVVLRGAVLVASGAHQVGLEAGNDYARERLSHELRIFEEAASVPFDLARAAIDAALGRPAPSTPEPRFRLVPTVTPELAVDVALDASSPHLDRGAWLDPTTEGRLASDVTSTGRFAVFAYGEHRLTRSGGPGPVEPANATLFTEIHTPHGVDLVAPFDGAVSGGRGVVELDGAFGRITITGARNAADRQPVVAGDVIGTTDASFTVSWTVPADGGGPSFTTASWFPAHRRRTADPALLLGLEPVDRRADAAPERARRDAVTPGAAERYYERPPWFERGWRELLVDSTGRPFLDLVNNVAGIGHGHPRLADAVHEQSLRLNTNSRFLYAALADVVERLRELAPDPSLSEILLVNSGSEAVDLALRLARAHTRRFDVVTLREAYHGWTSLSDAVSTSAYDNPDAAGSRPAFVHVADAVNPYRGTHLGPDSGPAYAADVVRLLDEMDAAGRPVGAFVCEPVFGNGGGVLLPDGYLREVYAAVRDRGGVCVADEVQVGLGRLGRWTWGVEQQSVVPDVLAVAKALGNAYPLGAVFTTPEIAASLEREGMFFSSSGGATASAVAGLAVLDVMRDEGLQENARVVGDHLATRFAELAERHPLIGAIHGAGLYQGVELVLDRSTKAPAVAETAWICERLLDLGVIMQSTSERRNVLKIKPPLTLTIEHADVFVAALDTVLGEVEARYPD